MSNNFFLSRCCGKEAQVVFSDIPDFIGDDPAKQRIGTAYFRCVGCGKPCDILPLEEVIGLDKDKAKKERDELKKERDELHRDSLIITKTTNGYLLEGVSSESGLPIPFVREEDEKDELKHHETLLWDIMEYFGFSGSKHDPERIVIKREKKKR